MENKQYVMSKQIPTEIDNRYAFMVFADMLQDMDCLQDHTAEILMALIDACEIAKIEKE